MSIQVMTYLNVEKYDRAILNVTPISSLLYKAILSVCMYVECSRLQSIVFKIRISG